jgi:hypothetical protein
MRTYVLTLLSMTFGFAMVCGTRHTSTAPTKTRLSGTENPRSKSLRTVHDGLQAREGRLSVHQRFGVFAIRRRGCRHLHWNGAPIPRFKPTKRGFNGHNSGKRIRCSEHVFGLKIGRQTGGRDEMVLVQGVDAAFACLTSRLCLFRPESDDGREEGARRVLDSQSQRRSGRYAPWQLETAGHPCTVRPDPAFLRWRV